MSEASVSALVSMLFGAAGAAAATALTLSPASRSVTAGSASAAYTVGVNGALSSSKAVTLSDAGAGGTFTPASLTLTSGAPSGTFTYTPAPGAPSGTVTLTAAATGLTSAAAAAAVTASGPAYPSLTLVSPTFVAGKNGQALSGGSATGQFLPGEPTTGDFQVELWLKYVGTVYSGLQVGDHRFFSFTDSAEPAGAGNTSGFYFDGSGIQFGWGDYNNHYFIGGSSNVNDSYMHHLMITCHNVYSSTYVNMFWDGVSRGHQGGSQLYFKNPINVRINFAEGPGLILDSFKFVNWAVTADDQGSYGASPFTPQALFTRDSITAMLCQLDGNGTGS